MHYLVNQLTWLLFILLFWPEAGKQCIRQLKSHFILVALSDFGFFFLTWHVYVAPFVNTLHFLTALTSRSDTSCLGAMSPPWRLTDAQWFQAASQSRLRSARECSQSGPACLTSGGFSSSVSYQFVCLNGCSHDTQIHVSNIFSYLTSLCLHRVHQVVAKGHFSQVCVSTHSSL